MIEVGSKAPEFDLPAAGGGRVSAGALRGRRYALYFYPKASTSGCTVQAQGVQENLAALAAAGITVIGVSPDPVRKLDAFARTSGLTFPLASDADQSLARAYDAWVEKSIHLHRVSAQIRQ